MPAEVHEEPVLFLILDPPGRTRCQLLQSTGRQCCLQLQANRDCDETEQDDLSDSTEVVSRTVSYAPVRAPHSVTSPLSRVTSLVPEWHRGHS